MKTKWEAERIQKFCTAIAEALNDSEVCAELKYNDNSEYVSGYIDGTAIEISVWGDNTAAASRDIIRGICKIL